MPDNDAKLKLIVEMEQDPDNVQDFTDRVAKAVQTGVEAGLDEGFKKKVIVTVDLGTPSADEDADRVGKEDLKTVSDTFRSDLNAAAGTITTKLDAVTANLVKSTDLAGITAAIGNVSLGQGEKTDLGPVLDKLDAINDDNLELMSTDLEGIYTEVHEINDKLDSVDLGTPSADEDADRLEEDVSETRGIIQRILDWLRGENRRKKDDDENEDSGQTRSIQSNDSGGMPIVFPEIFGRIGDWLGRLFNFGGKKDKDDDDDDDDKDDTKFSEKWTPIILKGVSLGTQALKAVSDVTLGFVSNIYRYMKQSSPLLQSVESLFNLAMTLFFLPLGTKLAEEILPATLDMIDAVVDMWDSFDGKTLGEIASDMVAEGAKIFGTYFQDIGESLSEQTGVIGAIGGLITDIGRFIENKGEKLINTVLDVAEFIISHFKEFVTLYIALKGVEIGAALGSSIPIVGSLIGGLLGGTIAGGLSYSLLTSWGFAEGGYVPATEGGAIARVAEAGEGEYIVPESKVKGFAEGVTGSGGNTYNINISGYTDSELKRYVTDIVNEQVAFSRLKGSF